MPNNQKKSPLIPAASSSPFSPTARRNARSYALQAMYQWQIAGGSIPDIENEFLRYHINHINNPLDLEFFKELIHGIPKLQEKLDQTMRPFLARPLEELDPIELAVLRVALYELAERPDIPYRVVINEALELTKTFGSIEGYKFINGVLDRVAKIKLIKETNKENKEIKR